MCLSQVYKVEQGEKRLIKQDVARMERCEDGYRLFGLLGDSEFVRGRVLEVDFLDTHEVIIEKAGSGSAP